MLSKNVVKIMQALQINLIGNKGDKEKREEEFLDESSSEEEEGKGEDAGKRHVL